MTVYQVRSLFFTFALERNRHANARSACRVFNEAVVSCRCRLPCCAGHPLNSEVATTSGHTCLILGNEVRLSMPVALANSFVIALIRISGLALSLHPHRLSEAAAIGPGRTPQPTSSEPMSQSVQNPARHISVVCGPCLPLAHLSDVLDRRAL
jgi:hypothetical protein